MLATLPHIPPHLFQGLLNTCPSFSFGARRPRVPSDACQSDTCQCTSNHSPPPPPSLSCCKSLTRTPCTPLSSCLLHPIYLSCAVETSAGICSALPNAPGHWQEGNQRDFAWPVCAPDQLPLPDPRDRQGRLHPHALLPDALPPRPACSCAWALSVGAGHCPGAGLCCSPSSPKQKGPFQGCLGWGGHANHPHRVARGPECPVVQGQEPGRAGQGRHWGSGRLLGPSS